MKKYIKNSFLRCPKKINVFLNKHDKKLHDFRTNNLV